jgi:dihydrofolate synthase / folylpolyglutamate synthase
MSDDHSHTPACDEYQATLRALFARTNLGIKLGLDTMAALLDALGRPDRHMRHIVVAGTNGKGSTSGIIAGALSAAGYRVGHYTSPHLLRFTERIRSCGREISREDVVRLYDVVNQASRVCPRPPTFFELVTAMGLMAFAEAGIELAVLEVGMGGRLDATNAVDKLLAVITPVDFDHMHFLGNTLAAIAFEKAGIIAAGGAVVVAAQHAEALATITAVASERGARLIPMAPLSTSAGGGIRIELRGGPLTVARPPPGAYQRVNVATAATALRDLAGSGLACPDAAIVGAAEQFRWPGRYDWIAGQPDVLVDGAHNPAGIRALLAAIAEDAKIGGRPVHVVATVLSDRPADQMLPPLAARATSLHLTPVHSTRTRTPAELGELLPGARVHTTAAEALSSAQQEARASGGIVVACGSLLLAGEALSLLRGEERDPPVDA